jgi:hypothetical protein
MKKFKIISNHTVTEDSYKEGEIKDVNFYTLNETISAESPEEAVKKYINEKLYYGDTSFEKDECCGWYSDFLVESNNEEPTKNQIEEWKKGIINLYNNHVNFEVYEMNLVNPINRN